MRHLLSLSADPASIDFFHKEEDSLRGCFSGGATMRDLLESVMALSLFSETSNDIKSILQNFQHSTRGMYYTAFEPIYSEIYHDFFFHVKGIKKYDRLFLPLSPIFLLCLLSGIYASIRFQQLSWVSGILRFLCAFPLSNSRHLDLRLCLKER